MSTTSHTESASEEQRKRIDQLARSISGLCHTVIARRLGQFFEVIGEEVTAAAEEREAELIRRMTAAMREADTTFERVGGSTRHHVRDCLLPVLKKHGLELSFLSDEQSAPYGHAMLPNDSHPGPGCSCRECLRAHPDERRS